MRYDKIVLLHRGGGDVISFDVLVKEGVLSEEELQEHTDSSYNTNCSIVKKFCEYYSGYRYVGSEDLNHIFRFNVGNFLYLIKLYKEGFKFVLYNEDTDDFCVLMDDDK